MFYPWEGGGRLEIAILGAGPHTVNIILETTEEFPTDILVDLQFCTASLA
jgi:hypothetical protein